MAARFDDDDEVMRFEITDKDLEEEMGAHHNQRPRMSKNQVTFGRPNCLPNFHPWRQE